MKATLAALVVALSFSVPSLAQEPSPTPPPAKTRIGKKVYRPHEHVKIVRHFTPTSTPTPAYVQATIIPVEAARWHVSQSWLMSRIGCETGHTYRYYAHNASGASGLGQFMPSTWVRALQVWSRAVELVHHTTRLVHKKVVISYSDGSRRVVRGALVRRAVTIVRRGWLPRWPSAYHGWASVRGAARAMAGLGNVRASEWSCG